MIPMKSVAVSGVSEGILNVDFFILELKFLYDIIFKSASVFMVLNKEPRMVEC